MRKLLCFGGRGLLEYIYILSMRAGDIILTLSCCHSILIIQEILTRRSFRPVLFVTPMEQVMITDHDPPRGDGHGLPEKSRCGFPML